MHSLLFFFFFNDTATTEIYTLSLHDALPIFSPDRVGAVQHEKRDLRLRGPFEQVTARRDVGVEARSDVLNVEHQGIQVDRKSTRLNSSHSQISYAVFCLKKKKNRHIAAYSI